MMMDKSSEKQKVMIGIGETATVTLEKLCILPWSLMLFYTQEAKRQSFMKCTAIFFPYMFYLHLLKKLESTKHLFHKGK